MKFTKEMDFKEKVSRTITRHSLPGKDAPVLIALSGGADSVALLRVMLSLGYQCEAAHCNFHLRGEESERDEAFVRMLCDELNVGLHVAAFDTKAYAAGHKISVEMAARELRYDFFRRLTTNGTADYVAVAHHRDDNAETVLLNIIRGTGLRGLCGMQYLNGNVMRPLLDVSRKEITDYLESLGQTYVTDSTNLQTDVTRNKIRLDVLPLLSNINPSINETLHREAGKLQETMTIYKWAVENILKNITRNAYGDEMLTVASIPAGVSLEAVLYEWLYTKGFGETRILDAYKASQGTSRVCFEAEKYMLFFEQGVYYLASKDSFPKFVPFALPEKGKVRLWNGKKMLIERSCDAISEKELKLPCNAFMDSNKLKFPLTLRAARNGDRFVPFGMNGTKLVSDYLSDRKIPWAERLRQLVVEDGEKIVWLVGRRVDNRVKITPNTKDVVSLRLA